MISYGKLLILKLSGTAEIKNKNEIVIPEEMTPKKYKPDVLTAEIVGDGKYIMRGYRYSKLEWQARYSGEKRDGMAQGWDDKGNLYWKIEYKNGEIFKQIL